MQETNKDISQWANKQSSRKDGFWDMIDTLLDVPWRRLFGKQGYFGQEGEP